MLLANDLSFRYPRQDWILQNFNMEIAPGEVVGLLGPSGFGKTTLSKLLAGYLSPTAGHVMINHAPLPRSGYCPVQLIFQNPELAVNPRWRIQQILAEKQMPEPSLLEALGIHSGWLNRYPHELSGGELQRVAVARVLNPTTSYLIADEMTAMLDANTQALIWHRVLDYALVQNLGLLVISHEAALIQRLCNRVIDLVQVRAAERRKGA